MPKNKKLLKLLNEQGVKQQVQRVELDRLADRKLPARDQKMRDMEDDLLLRHGRARPLGAPHGPGRGDDVAAGPHAVRVPDISHAVHELDHDPDLSPAEKIERRRAVEAEYATKSETLHIIHKLLQAHALYEKDVEYVVQDGQVFIVDEFTGRLMPGRAAGRTVCIRPWKRKEGVAVREESQTLATITIQNYFRMYEKLAGMTGTAETEETEFPPDLQARSLRDSDKPPGPPRGQARPRLQDAQREVRRDHGGGGAPAQTRPAGAGRDDQRGVSETLARILKRRGLKHEVLNAKFHEREAEIVAQGGPARFDHHRNQHGRPRHRHQTRPGRQEVSGLRDQVAGSAVRPEDRESGPQ